MTTTPKIYDTTLRDGTQGTGISYSVLDKIRIAEKLDQFGVHYIEGGWPGSNPKDVEFFREARQRTWKHARIAAFGSTRRGDIAVEEDPQLRTLLEAETPVVTIVGKSWLLHVQEILKVSPDENRAMIRESIAHLKSHGREVFYDAEHFFDGYKDNPEYAVSTIRGAVEAGVDLPILCDTNGGTLPEEIEAIVRDVIAKIGTPVGIHTHNDTGLGVANALAAVRAGAVQVQGTINGYGERTGNCNLTSVMPTLVLKMGRPVVPDISRLRELSLFVDEVANHPHDIHAPYVGTTAFAHKGGIHVNAVQKLARSYEHIRPEEVGNRQVILVSELSGQSNILLKAQALGFTLEKGSPEVAKILKRIKEQEAIGYEYEAADGSLDLLIRRTLGIGRAPFELLEYHTTFRQSGGDACNTCEATVKLLVDGRKEYTVEEGNGPVDALAAALRKALRTVHPCVDRFRLEDYKVRIVDGKQGTAARTRVLIDSTDGSTTWSTVGVSDNIIKASWLALVDAIEYRLRGRD
ncbi:MAG TPA: citramalate synthase [Chthoniobacteraceae bacterium]|nr:citramalate synthase [Chthoniobacteraceae bacterium]